VSRKQQVEIDGVELTLTNLDKVLYPAAGFTKAGVIHYYHEIAPAMLPHLKGRPLTMKRFPDGVRSEYFYGKQCPAYRPESLRTATIKNRGEDKQVSYCLIGSPAELVWVANLASLELHTLLCSADDVSRPTMMVFDLDPGAPAGILDAAQAAFWLRDALDQLGLTSFIKTSGVKGLHLYVPLNDSVTFEDTKSFARGLARVVEKEHAGEITSNMRKDMRVGKVFVDWSQNDHHKTTVCVYSLRAQERPTVSMPVTWDELKLALTHKDADGLSFEAEAALARVGKSGDIFEQVLTLKQKLPELAAVA